MFAEVLQLYSVDEFRTTVIAWESRRCSNSFYNIKQREVEKKYKNLKKKPFQQRFFLLLQKQ